MANIRINGVITRGSGKLSGLVLSNKNTKRTVKTDIDVSFLLAIFIMYKFNAHLKNKIALQACSAHGAGTVNPLFVLRLYSAYRPWLD